MGINQSRSSERTGAEVIVLSTLREWKKRFEENPLDPESIVQGLVTLSEISESTLVNAVKHGQKVDEVHESQQQMLNQLEVVRDRLDTAISRFEGASAVQENESNSVAEELRCLHQGIQEVKAMSQALLDHFNIKFYPKSPT